MLREEIVKKLNTRAGTYSGRIGKHEFGVDSGPFNESSCNFVAYLIDDYSGDCFFDSADEFFNEFIVDGKPIGQQLDIIESFSAILCND